MLRSRREFIAGAAGAAAAGVLAPGVSAVAVGNEKASPEAIVAIFKGLPGDVAVKIYAPATKDQPEFLVQSNASKVLVIGSAFKTFVLCEACVKLTLRMW